jgi:hypothetical protein
MRLLLNECEDVLTMNFDADAVFKRGRRGLVRRLIEQ